MECHVLTQEYMCVYIYVRMYIYGVCVEGLLLCQQMTEITLTIHKTPVVSLLDVCMYVCMYVYVYIYIHTIV